MAKKNLIRYILFFTIGLFILNIFHINIYAKEVIIESKEEKWNEIKQVLQSFTENSTWTNPEYDGAITTTIPKTAILGNGNMGVTSYGNATEKTYILSTCDFLCDKANSFLNAASFYNTTALTGGGLTISTIGNNLNNISFKEELDIEKGEIRTNMTLGHSEVAIKSWLSNNKNILVTNINSLSPNSQNIAITTWAYNGNPVSRAKCKISSGISNKVAWVTRKSNDEPSVNYVSEVAIATKVLGNNKASLFARENKSTINLSLPPNGTLTIVTTMKGSGKIHPNSKFGDDGIAYESAIKLQDHIQNEKDVSKLYNNLINWWKNYYTLSYIDFNDKDLNRIYYGMQYLFGSSTRQGSVAPGLYGPWITVDNPNYSNDYHLDYNFQSAYFGAFSSNRMKEFTSPFFKAILNFMDTSLYRSADKNEIRKIIPWYVNYRIEKGDFSNGISGGALYPCSLGPYLPFNVAESYYGQTKYALICASLFISYYRYTLDNEWLNTKVNGHTPYEFVKAVATFYEKWIEKRNPRIDSIYKKNDNIFLNSFDENDKKYPPYNGGEDYVYILYDGSMAGSFNLNPASINGNVMNLMNGVLEMSNALKVDENRQDNWNDIANHLVGQEVSLCNYNGKLALGFSEDCGVKDGYATYNFDFIYPGNQLGFDSSPMLLAAARQGMSYPLAWTNLDAMAKVYTQAVYAQYNSDILINQMKKNIPLEANNIPVDGVHGIDKIAIVEALNSMMVQTSNGVIKVFANFPKSQNVKFSDIRQANAFLISSKQTNKTVEYVRVLSEQGARFNMVNPWGNSDVMIIDQDKNLIKYDIGETKNSREQVISFDTKIGSKYIIVLDPNLTK